MGYYHLKYCMNGGNKKNTEKFIAESKTMLENKIKSETDQSKREEYEELLKQLNSFESKFR